MYDTRTEPDTFSPQSAHAGSAPPVPATPAPAGIHTIIRHSRDNLLRHSRDNLLRHSRDNLLRHSRDNLLRHSREGGNPQFPRTREFIVPLPQCPNAQQNTPSFPLLRHFLYSVIPATTCSVIPAKAGMTLK